MIITAKGMRALVGLVTASRRTLTLRDYIDIRENQARAQREFDWGKIEGPGQSDDRR
jgi:hypothetical protein